MTGYSALRTAVVGHGLLGASGRQELLRSATKSPPSLAVPQAAQELNDRPRKRLGFRKPIEEIGELLLR